MTNPPAPVSLGELSDRFELELRGDATHLVRSVGSLRDGGPDTVSFLSNRAYLGYLANTRAGVVILKAEDAETCPTNCLLAANPYLSYARIAGLFDTRATGEPGIHKTAVVDDSARLGRDLHVGANAVIGADCRIGDACSIGPGSVLGDGCRLGAGCRLVANVTLCDRVKLGQRVLVHPGAVIGADGFGNALAEDHWEKVPQLGSVIIGDDCEIGSNSCIDRGAISDTVLEEDVRIDNLCQIGHNCHIGAHTAMAAYTGISGSTKIGRNCLFAGRSGCHGHIEIADGVTVSAMTMVKKSITEPGTTWSGGIPARPIREWQRSLAHLKRMERTARRIRKLEQQNRKSDCDE